MHEQYMCPLARVVHGSSTSWEPVVATVYHKDLLGIPVWSPCNRFIAVAKNGAVEIRDGATLNLFCTFNISLYRQILHLLFSPDSCCLTLVNDEEFVTWDLQTGGSVDIPFPKGLHVNHEDITSVYSMDGKMLAVVHLDEGFNNTFIATYNLSTTCTQLHHVTEGRIIR